MDPTITFGPSNYGTQMGINHGPVTVNHQTNLEDKLPVVHDAAFNSYKNQHEDECLEGTRTGTLAEIQEWASSPQSKCIFWLNGMAGTGKSTISRTLARRFKETNTLGASFFFKRGERDRGNATKLFTTIACQLATSLPALRPHMENAVRSDPSISRNGLREQFDKLLLEPLLCLKPSDPTSRRTVIIVMDALDECEGDRDISLILRILPDLQKSTSIQLRIFVTSRPDLPIHLGFTKTAHNEIILHRIAPDIVRHDISLFLNDRFMDIREKNEFSSDWPGEDKLRKLVELSVPLFIFAATIYRLLDDDSWDPEDSLEEILKHRGYTKLDGTYLPALNRLISGPSGQIEARKRQLVQEFREIIGTIVLLESPLAIPALSRLLGIPEKTVRLRVIPLRSCLNIPDDQNSPVRLYHLSFRDFLLDPETREKTELWVDEKQAHYYLMKCCFVTCDQLRRNIASFENDGFSFEETPRQDVDISISAELQYACRYWAYHLVRCEEIEKVLPEALSFLEKHFLHWVEAMSLLDLTLEVLEIVHILEQTIKGCNHKEMSQFLYEARRFMLKNRQMIGNAPLQLYSSALMFLPQSSKFRQQFESDLSGAKFRLISQPQPSWGADLQVLEGHKISVTSLAFSPDQKLLASSSLDHTIRIWDAVTGMMQQTLKGQSASVTSVAFSRDGSTLASASKDATVRLWDTTTGVLQKSIHGQGIIRSVKYSPDGQTLLFTDHSGIHLWDTTTSSIQRSSKPDLPDLPDDAFWMNPLSEIMAVEFSRDGKTLISASGDGKLRIWDTSTGILRKLLAEDSGHQVAFSPNGQLVAGDESNKVKLWDIETFELKSTFEFSWLVCSVSFSTDGRWLAVGGFEGHVELLDVESGTKQSTLQGHSATVDCLAFSPYGDLLASGSSDTTIRLYEVDLIPQSSNPTFSSDLVQSMAFSPNGRVLASVDLEKTIYLWNSQTGALEHSLSDNEGRVVSVDFSSDSRFLASGSSDKISLWDTSEGTLLKTFRPHGSGIKQISLSSDGKLLASVHWDRMTVITDIATGAKLKTLQDEVTDIPSSVAFSPDCLKLAVGCDGYGVLIWDLSTSEAEFLLTAPGIANSVAFSPDGRLLAGLSDHRSIAVHETINYDGVGGVVIDRDIQYFGFSHDNSYFNTNWGALDSRIRPEYLNLDSSDLSLKVTIELNEWVTVDNLKERVLWLPSDFRPRCLAVHGNVLALGHLSGRVSFLEYKT